MTDKKTIDNFYFSRFIDSLEQDKDKWIMKECAGGDISWTEYHGPEYKNEAGERLQFSFSLNYTGAYVNGIIMWKIPYVLNPFSHRCRRFMTAKRKMIEACKTRAIQEYNNILMNAL